MSSCGLALFFELRILLPAMSVRAALAGGFLANVEQPANRFAQPFDRNQPCDGTNIHIKGFAGR